MSETFRCDDKDTLVAYLYGEIDAASRREVERHLRTCPACAQETDGLQQVRHDLETWLPPDRDLGVATVQKPAVVLSSTRWAALRTLPAWARVAAAILVMSVGAAIANLHVRYGTDGLTVSTGWLTPDAARTDGEVRSATPMRAVANADESWKLALGALEQNLRRELLDATRRGDSGGNARGAAPGDAAAMLHRVQTMLDASERRQREEMALRLTQANRDWNLQRQADLLRINQSFGTLQGRTYSTEARQVEVMNILRRVSAAQPIP